MVTEQNKFLTIFDITIERKGCEPTRGECWRVITNKELHDPIK